ncbi:MAG: tetratricopeptide repeat protein [Polyangia bacterium]
MLSPGGMRRCLLAFGLLLGQLVVARADSVATARQHYERGATLYDLGRFADAAKEFEAAYEDKNDPALLFNIARAYRFAGSYSRSLIAYRAYLRNLPNAANRAQVESNIAELDQLIQRQQSTAATTPPVAAAPTTAVATAAPASIDVAKAAPERRPVYKKWWFWTTAGVVVVGGLAVGLAVGLAKPTSSERVLPPVTGAP